jgi:hypothetical protein
MLVLPPADILIHLDIIQVPWLYFIQLLHCNKTRQETNMTVSAATENGTAKSWNISDLTNVSSWVKTGMDRLMASQKILMDLVANQNTIATNALKDQLDSVVASPGATLSGFAREGLHNSMEAQKVMLDLLRKQNDIVLGGVKDAVGNSGPISAMTELLRRSVKVLVESQQDFLTAAEKQTNAWLDSARAGEVFGDKEARQLIREGLDNFERTQRKLLDAFSEAASWSEDKESPDTGSGEAKSDLGGMARDSADALLQAQKKILDLAGQQASASLKATRETIDMVEPPRQSTVESRGRESLDNLITAQKAQIDLLAKTFDSETKTAQ